MNNRNLKMKDISEIVCNYFEVDEKDIFVRTRKREILNVRQIIQFFSEKYTNLSLIEIGNYLDIGFDHTTIIHSRKTIEDLYDSDLHIKKAVDYLDYRIKDLMNNNLGSDIDNLITEIKHIKTRHELNSLLLLNIKL